MTTTAALTRRECLRTAAGVCALAAMAGFAPASPARAADRRPPEGPIDGKHYPFGPVRPERRLTAWPVQLHSGQATDLASQLRGRVTALQLMFTGCNATCPIQGALFAQAQQGLRGTVADAQFLSVSIDALGDTPAALAAWLRKFGAQPGWVAAVPRVQDVDALIELLGRDGLPRPTGPDPHTGQVYLVNRRGELTFRTPSMPSASQIIDALRGVAAQR